ncbi:ATP-binding cassette domain-containing protein [Streptomyces sp. ID05-26A]|nr:ATP-binding cassette domain-containing protein [Streptomyces sp. ID05-26A]
MTAELEVSSGGRSWTFPPGAPVLVGRGSASDVVLDDPAVSRNHLRIEYDNGWVLRDPGSSGGTWADGRQVREQRITGEFVVRLADEVEVVFRCGTATPPNGVISIGRAADNDLVLVDPMVSRRHATARYVGDGWRVSDLGSANPVLHNGEPVAAGVVVSCGDLLTFGSTDVLVTPVGLTPLPGAERHLVVDNVGFTLPSGKPLLSGVSLNVRPGELVAVVGPSGAGKSTLLKVLTGTLVPTRGHVSYDGLDVHDHPAVRERIGVVPQKDVMHVRLSARRALAYAAKLRLPADTTRRERDDVVAAALEQVDLTPQARTTVRRLSGGQQKRVSIAMELLTSPPLLLLDEPTSGLDPWLDKQIMNSLRAVADTGRSVVVVTHNPDNLAQCDRILVLAPGGVPFFLGAPDELRVRFGAASWADIFEAAASRPVPTGAGAPERRVPASVPQPAATPRTVWRQLATLVSRHTRLILADPGYAAFLLLIPLSLAGLALAVPGDAGLGPPGAADPTEPTQMLVLLFVGAEFTGGACGAREIVAERAIFLRERAAGLRPRAYGLSKLMLFGVIVAVQAVLLVAGTLAVKPGPADAVLLGHQAVELVVAVWLTAFATCALSLVVSAWVKSSEQVMPLLVVLVMAQLVLCGGMIPVTDRPVLEQLSWLAPARWGYAAGASTVDVRSHVPGVPAEPLWRHEPLWWLLSAGILVAMTVPLAVLLVRRVSRLRAE